MHNLIRMLA